MLLPPIDQPREVIRPTDILPTWMRYPGPDFDWYVATPEQQHTLINHLIGELCNAGSLNARAEYLLGRISGMEPSSSLPPRIGREVEMEWRIKELEEQLERERAYSLALERREIGQSYNVETLYRAYETIRRTSDADAHRSLLRFLRIAFPLWDIERENDQLREHGLAMDLSASEIFSRREYGEAQKDLHSRFRQHQDKIFKLLAIPPQLQLVEAPRAVRAGESGPSDGGLKAVTSGPPVIANSVPAAKAEVLRHTSALAQQNHRKVGEERERLSREEIRGRGESSRAAAPFFGPLSVQNGTEMANLTAPMTSKAFEGNEGSTSIKRERNSPSRKNMKPAGQGSVTRKRKQR